MLYNELDSSLVFFFIDSFSLRLSTTVVVCVVALISRPAVSIGGHRAFRFSPRWKLARTVLRESGSTTCSVLTYVLRVKQVTIDPSLTPSRHSFTALRKPCILANLMKRLAARAHSLSCTSPFFGSCPFWPVLLLDSMCPTRSRTLCLSREGITPRRLHTGEEPVSSS